MGWSGRWYMCGFEVGMGRFCFGEWGLGLIRGWLFLGMVW